MIRRCKKDGRTPEVRHVRDLFAVYKNKLRAPEKSVVVVVIAVIDEVVGIQVPVTQCRYNIRTRTISLHTSGVVKDRIRLHTSEILTILESKLGTQSCPHIIM